MKIHSIFAHEIMDHIFDESNLKKCVTLAEQNWYMDRSSDINYHLRRSITSVVFELYGVWIRPDDIILRPTPRGIEGDFCINNNHLLSLINKVNREHNPNKT